MTELKFFTVPKAARVLNVHPQTFRRIVKRGQIATLRVGERVVITESAIDEYLKRSTQPAAA